MKLIKFESLEWRQRQEVERVFVLWRYDLTARTFEEWAAKHAFWFTKSGHLARRRYAEPAFMADEPKAAPNSNPKA